jgi:SAM-dependent methyltransferase
MPQGQENHATLATQPRPHAAHMIDRAGTLQRPPESEAEKSYSQALHRHLSGMPQKEIDFFVNARRVAMLDRLIGDELRRPGCNVLNAACGPFALEFYLPLPEAQILSFDREAILAPLHRDLIYRQLIGDTQFVVANVETFTPPHPFDAVVINDLYYSKHVDFYATIGRFIACLKPGGILYFDIQDQRAGPVWKVFGRDTEFRRYDLTEVARVLTSNGLTIDVIEPALGIKGGADFLLRKGMWKLAGIANSSVFVARKPAASA